MTATSAALQRPGPQPLLAERLDPAVRAQRHLAGLPSLGGLAWGCTGPGLAAVGMPVLSAGGPWIDCFTGATAAMATGVSDPPHRNSTGRVLWQADADWAFGHIDLPDVDVEADCDLAKTSYRAYTELFAALKACGRPHLQRLWNYLPRINADGGGLELYRQFNIGRQQAFLDAGRDAFGGSPAACALGMAGGGLAIRFLAGRVPPLPLENPRQVPAWRYSTQHGPRAPTFSRAALAEAGGGQVLLLMSGTASIVGETSLHPGDVQAQTHETLRNLQAVLDAAMARCSARFSLGMLQPTIYVRHAADAPAVLALWAQAVAGAGSGAMFGAPQACCVQADICRAELLVEIEAHALAAGALA